MIGGIFIFWRVAVDSSEMDEHSEIDESLVCWLGAKENPNPSSMNANDRKPQIDESLVCWLGAKETPNPSSMNANARKTQGIYKGFKYISQIFVKERELEIGYPTDVKHVGHVGWDSSTSPTKNNNWMNNDLNTSSNFSSRSLGHLLDNDHPSSTSLKAESWSSQDFEQVITQSPNSDIFQESQPSGLPKVPRKHKRKKAKSLSSTTESQFPLSNIFRPKTKVAIPLAKDSTFDKMERHREPR